MPFAAADLERHHGAELGAQKPLLDLDGAGYVAAVRKPLLADQWCPHIRDDRHPILVDEIQRRDQRHATPLGIEPAHIEKPEIRAATAARAEDPGADRQRLDVVERDLSHKTRGLCLGRRARRPDQHLCRNPELVMEVTDHVDRQAATTV